jgi:hypothetical protein
MKLLLRSLTMLVCLLSAWGSCAQTTISYAQQRYCTNANNPSPTITGASNGLFSAGAGIAINSNTGTLDLASSIAGIYTVSYIVGGDTANTTVEIVEQDDASFVFVDSVLCIYGSSGQPVVNTPGGRFSYFSDSTKSLCLDSITGEINYGPCFSDTGTFIIQYTTAGACPSSSTQRIRMAINPGFTITYPGSRTYCRSRGIVSPTVIFGNGNSALASYNSTVGIVLDSVTGAINVGASQTGSYVINYTLAGDCPSSSASTVIVLPNDDARFNYSDSVYCRFGADPTPVVTGLSGGNFSGDAGVALNASTGEVDLGSSLLGQFTIRYTTNGQCPNTDSVLLQIDTLDDASFAYDTTKFCQNGGVVSPTVTGEQGGVFNSVPFGLALNATTGAIDLANSAVSNYTIVYQTNNPCASSSTFDIDIDGVPTFIFDYPLDTYCTNDSSRPRPFASPSFGFGQASASPAGLAISTPGELILENSLPNVYVVTYVTNPVNNVCQLTYTDTITVLAGANAFFNYGAVRFCTSDPPITPFLVNNTGGVFTANNGLVLDSITGTVDFGVSAPGNYVVTYTTLGYCSSTFSQNIQIDAFPTTNLSYGTGVFCKGGSNPTPILGGTTGGQFSGSAGLVINTFSGEIDLTATPAGAYTVYYNLTTSCVASDSTSILINDRNDAAFFYAKTNYCQNEPLATPIAATTGGIFSSSPLGLVYATNTGSIDVANSAAGTYTITYTTTGNCPDTSTQALTINELPSAAFSYPQTSYCQREANPNPIITGSTGGIFSSDSLTIDILFGQIDLTTASPGLYTVQYKVGVTGCADSSSTSVTINSSEDAGFAYPKTIYCQNEPFVIPLINTPGGSFVSAPSGLAYNVNAGIIDLNNSIPGTYTITYATGGPCSDSSSLFVTVLPTPSAAFTFAKDTYCLGASNPTPTVIGAAGGQFTATNNLPIDPLLGSIALNSAALGTYAISYRVSNASCTDSSNLNISIVLPDTAGFAYTDTLICINGGNNIVLGANGTTGGIYSAVPTGVVFADAATGEIAVSNTAAGTYTVSYITNGNCPDTATIVLTATFCLQNDKLPKRQRYGLYPNPNTGSFYIVSEAATLPSTIRVMDVLGRVVYEQREVLLTPTAHAIQLPNGANGAYWLLVENAAGSWQKKIIVARP